MNRFSIAALILCVPLLGGAHWTEQNDADVSEGQEAFAQGDFARAVERFRAALAGEGDRARLHYDLGTAQIQWSSSQATQQEREQELDLAIVSLRSANARKGTALREQVDYNLATALVLRGRFEDAVVVYRRHLIQNPEHDDARHNLELALLAMRALQEGDKRLADRLRGIAVPDDGSSPAGHTGPATAAGPAQPLQGQDTGSAGAADGGPVAEAGATGEAGNENPNGTHAQGAANESEATASAEEGPEGSAARALPGSTSKLSLKKKLDALERRSAELRRASILRKTTSRVRNPDTRAKDQ